MYGESMRSEGLYVRMGMSTSGRGGDVYGVRCMTHNPTVDSIWIPQFVISTHQE